MLRWMTPFLVAMFAIGTAAAEETAAPKDGPAAVKDAPAAAKESNGAKESSSAKDGASAAKEGSAATKDGTAATKDGAAAAKDSPAVSKDGPAPTKGKPAAPRRAAVRAASNLPPGLPRPYYKYRTTVAPAAPLYVRRGRQLVVVEEQTDVLFTPVGVVPFAPGVNGTPLLPGSSTLPGYYGTTHSYSYDGPYYGGPYTPYWNRLPYACGVYGYC
jgi:hypothetical protein